MTKLYGDYLTVKEASEQGFGKIQTLQQRIWRGKLKSVKLGWTHLIRRKDLEEWGKKGLEI